MKLQLWLFISCLFIIGCAGQSRPQIIYYDLEAINHIPGGVSTGLLRPGISGKREIVAILGTFSESSIEIASSAVLDTPLIVAWYDTNHVDHTRPFPFQILPPLDTINQKYHLRFTFYPNDSVRIQARAVAKSDCRHTIRHGATALSAFGPCVSDRGNSNTLDSIARGLIKHPWTGPMDIPGWN
jgi:hypothetical protein